MVEPVILLVRVDLVEADDEIEVDIMVVMPLDIEEVVEVEVLDVVLMVAILTDETDVKERFL